MRRTALSALFLASLASGTAAAQVTNAPPTIAFTPNTLDVPVISLTTGARFPLFCNRTFTCAIDDPDGDALTHLEWRGPNGLQLTNSGSFPVPVTQDGVVPGDVVWLGATPGAYIFTLIVRDARGAESSANLTVNVVLDQNTFSAGVAVRLTDARFVSDNDRPLGSEHPIEVTFESVSAPGLTWLDSRADLMPPPPAGMQAGSPPYYYDIQTTAGTAGQVSVCFDIRGMSFARAHSELRVHELVSGVWSELASQFAPNGNQICGDAASLGTFAIFYPEAPETTIRPFAGTGFAESSIDGPGGDPRDDVRDSVPAGESAITQPAALARGNDQIYFVDRGDGSRPPQLRRVNVRTREISTLDPVCDPEMPIATNGAVVLCVSPVFMPGQRTITGYNIAQDVMANVAVLPDVTAIAIDPYGNAFFADGVNVYGQSSVVFAFNNSTSAAHTVPYDDVPRTLAFDGEGALLIGGQTLVRIRPGADGVVSGSPDESVTHVGGVPAANLVGYARPFAGDGLPAAQAMLNITYQMIVAFDGAVVYTDGISHRVRRIAPGADGVVNGGPDEIVRTIAGYYGLNAPSPSNFATSAYGDFRGVVEDVTSPGNFIVSSHDGHRLYRFGLSPHQIAPPDPYPDLAASKAFVMSGPPVTLLTALDVNNGDTLIFRLTASNVGTAPTTGAVTLTDTLPAGLSYAGGDPRCSGAGQVVTCVLAGPILLGQEDFADIVTQVGPSVAPQGQQTVLRNQVSVSTSGDTNASNDLSAPVALTVHAPPPPNLTATKHFVVGGSTTLSHTVDRGDPVRYRLTAFNVGSGPTTGPITLTDTLHYALTFVQAGSDPQCRAVAQAVTCQSPGRLAPNQSLSFDFNVQVDANAFGQTLLNWAAVATPNDSDSANDVSSAIELTVIGPGLPNLSAYKEFVAGGSTTVSLTVANGETVRYRLTAINVGSGPTTGPITFTDTLHPALTFVPGGSDSRCGAVAQIVTCQSPGLLAPNQSVSFDFNVQVGSNAAPLGQSVQIDNAATGATPDDTDDVNDYSNLVVLTVDNPDTTPPVVSPPPNIVVNAILASGTHGNDANLPDSVAVANFINGGSATDNLDPNPIRLPLDHVHCSNPSSIVDPHTPSTTTIFRVGTTCVRFRYQDASGNVGMASASITVNPPIGGVVSTSGVPVTATDANNVPQPVTLTFFGPLGDGGLVQANPIVPPPAVPTGFRIAGVAYNITTTVPMAVVTHILVCFSGAFVPGDVIYHNGNPVPTTVSGGTACATVPSVSPFWVLRLLDTVSPIAVLDAQLQVLAGQPLTLSAARSSDIGGTVARYRWQIPDAGIDVETSASSHVVPATLLSGLPLGQHTATLIVTDNSGNESAPASASFSLVAQSITPANAAPPSAAVQTINAGPGDQTDPHISNDLMTYTESSGSVKVIRFFGFPTGGHLLVPPGNDSLSDVNENHITFTRTDSTGATSALMYVPPTGHMHVVSGFSGTSFAPRIGDRTIAFLDAVPGDGADIVVYNFITGLRETLDRLPDFTSFPNVSPDGNTVVWGKCDRPINNCDVFRAERRSGTWVSSPVASTNSHEEHPDTDGTWIVYHSDRPGGTGGDDIYFQPIAGGAETRLDITGWQRNPSISGGVIAFESADVVNGIADLYVYDISTNLLYQITSTPNVNETPSDISVLRNGDVRVVWAADDGPNGEHNVYAETFSLRTFESTPPIALLDVPAQILASQTLTLSGSRSRDVGGTITAYRWTVPDAGIDVQTSASSYVVPAASVSALSVGPHTVTLTVTDGAGNQSMPATGVVTVIAQQQVVPVLAALSPVPVNVIGAGPDHQFNPHVYKNLMAYTNRTGNQVSVRYFNFSAGTDGIVPQPSEDPDFLADVNLDRILFSRPSSTGLALFLFDPSNASLSEIDPRAGTYRSAGALGGSTVAYVESLNDGDVVAYDLATGNSAVVSGSFGNDDDPATSPDGTVVASTRFDGVTQGDLYVAVRVQGAWYVSPFASTPDNEHCPDTDGTWIVYRRLDDTGRGSIFFRRVTGGPEFALGGFAEQNCPAISEGVISFPGRITATDAIDLFVYDIASNQVYQVTSNSDVELITDISILDNGDARVVWDAGPDDPGGTFLPRRVYATTFSLRDRVAPIAVLDVPLHLAPDQALTLSAARSSDVGGTVARYRWQIPDAGIDVETTTPTYTVAAPTGLSEGPHVVTLTVIDDSDNLSSSVSATVIVIAQQTVVPVLAGMSPGVIQPIDTGSDDENDPHVHKNLMAYSRRSGSGSTFSFSTVRYFDFSTGTGAAVPQASGELDFLPDVNQNRILFNRMTSSGDFGIFLFDLAAGSVTEIDPQPTTTRFVPALGAGTIAYQDALSNNGDIVSYDLTTGLTSVVDARPSGDTAPAVSPDGTVVVWQSENAATLDDIYMAVRAQGGWSVTPVAATSANEGGPDTDGTWIVYYRAGVDGWASVFYRAVAGGPEYRIAGFFNALNPAISDGVISFSGQITAAPSKPDLFVYDIASNQLYQVTSSADVGDHLNDISVLDNGDVRVVWAADESSTNDAHHNVYATTFSIGTPTTLAVAPASGVAGESIRLSATLTSNGSPVEDAQLEFQIDGYPAVAVVRTGPDGVASVGTPLRVNPGTYPDGIRVRFAGDAARRLRPASGSATLTVGRAPTALTLTVTPSTAPVTEPLTFVAAVSSMFGVPAGDVSFSNRDGTTVTPLYRVALEINGTARFVHSALPVGDHVICAEFAGSAIHAGSQDCTRVTVTRASTQTILFSNRSPSLSTGPPVFIATVQTTATVQPTGKVEFFADSTLLCRSTLFAGEREMIASCGGAPLTVGTHAITATFTGDTNFDASNSATLTQTVQPGTYFALDLGFDGEAVALSPNGWVAGNSELKANLSSASTVSAYVHEGTTLGMPRQIPSLGGAKTEAVGVDATGRVGGVSTTASGASHVFRFDGTDTHDRHPSTFGGQNSRATAMNSSGALVGFTDTATFQHAVVDLGAGMSDLGTIPGGAQSAAFAIGESTFATTGLAHIVGASTVAGGALHAAVFGGATVLDLGTLGGSTSAAFAVNNAGESAGFSTVSGGDRRAFVYRDGAMQDIGASLGSAASGATAINDAAQVVGTYEDASSGSSGAFLYSLDTTTDLGPGTFVALNNAGVVVQTASNQIVVRTGGSVITSASSSGLRRHVPGAVISATAVNDEGRIAGSILLPGGRPRATVWIPVPLASLAVEAVAAPAGSTVTIAATLTSQGSAVENKEIRFSINGVDAGTNWTDAAGRATVTAIVPALAQGTYPDGIQASFTGDETLGFASGTAQLTVESPPPPDVWILKSIVVPGSLCGSTCPEIRVSNGDEVRFRLVATLDALDGPLTGPITISDTLPAGLVPTRAFGTSLTLGFACGTSGQQVTCTLLDWRAMNPGDQTGVEIVAQVGPNVVGVNAVPLVNYATVATPNDRNPNNTSSAVVLVVGPPDASIEKSIFIWPSCLRGCRDITVSNGEEVEFAIDVRTENRPLALAGSLTLTDSFPIGLVPIRTNGGDFNCVFSGQVATCTARILVPWADTATAHIVARVGDTVAGLNQTVTLTNIATVAIANDANSANNTSQPAAVHVQGPRAGAPTGLGTNVAVQPTDANNVPQPITLTFTGVTQAGLTTAVPIVPPPPAPAGFQFRGTVYDISTTAMVTPPIEVCFIGAGFSLVDRISHDGMVLDDAMHTVITSTRICAVVSSLSPFGVVMPLNHAPTADAGTYPPFEATSPAGASVTLTASAHDSDGDPLSYTWTEGGVTLGTGPAITRLLAIGTHDITLTVDDGGGGIATAAARVVVRDTTPPAITIAAPADGATYRLNEVVASSYSCTDTAAGFATCAGPVANDEAVHTAAVGVSTFTVTATDRAGNAATATSTYRVEYGVCLLYDPTKAKKSGGTIPIKLQLCDATGRNASSPSIALAARGVKLLATGDVGPAEDAGSANPDQAFRYDATFAGYIFNLKTSGYTEGVYGLTFTVGDDPTLRLAEFRVR